MDFKYCKRCGNIYLAKAGKLFCNDCLDEFERYVTRIRDFIYEHPDTSISYLCDELDISEKDILYLIRENRIELTPKDGDLKGARKVCVRCGKPSLTEKYCRECKAELAKKMMGATENMRSKMPNGDELDRAGVMNRLYDKTSKGGNERK